MSSTDTNQANELFELCKEVYERTRSGHPITDFERGIVIHWEDGQMFDFPTDELDIEEYIAPLYTSDYLLEKLPGLLDIDNKTFSLAVQAQVAPPNFVALYTHTSVVAGKLAGHSTRYINVADTPLKALLKLTIALSEAGELK